MIFSWADYFDKDDFIGHATVALGDLEGKGADHWQPMTLTMEKRHENQECRLMISLNAGGMHALVYAYV